MRATVVPTSSLPDSRMPVPRTSVTTESRTVVPGPRTSPACSSGNADARLLRRRNRLPLTSTRPVPVDSAAVLSSTVVSTSVAVASAPTDRPCVAARTTAPSRVTTEAPAALIPDHWPGPTSHVAEGQGSKVAAVSKTLVSCAPRPATSVAPSSSSDPAADATTPAGGTTTRLPGPATRRPSW